MGEIMTADFISTWVS